MIVFCLAFGLLAGQMGPKGRLMVDFFVVLNDIIMKLVGVVMWIQQPVSREQTPLTHHICVLRA
ncbi:unnamed protein product [Timema podura]|uniref:Amino acid transporter n=1 Tax=Timema podura TaxID=61482 RepID=A0ABN7PK89_TIMPD|nr:unnamed protein product [Timema podura]